MLLVPLEHLERTQELAQNHKDCYTVPVSQKLKVLNKLCSFQKICFTDFCNFQNCFANCNQQSTNLGPADYILSCQNIVLDNRIYNLYLLTTMWIESCVDSIIIQWENIRTDIPIESYCYNYCLWNLNWNLGKFEPFPGLSCLKFGTSGRSHGQITLHMQLINNKLEIFHFSCNYTNLIPIWIQYHIHLLLFITWKYTTINTILKLINMKMRSF